MTARVFAAVDLGATSGRVVAGIVERDGKVSLRKVHRFPNGVRELDGHLRWDFTALFGEVCHGLALLAFEFPNVESIGIDTWGVDYGLLGADGNLLAEPISYRDGRTERIVDDVNAIVPADELYAITGIQQLPFNTLYQLAAEQRCPSWDTVAHVVLLPDLIAYWLTGALRTEYTNATTTGLIDARTRRWADTLLDRLGFGRDLLPPLDLPGAVRGAVRPDMRARLGVGNGTVVTTVASHDTASAVAAIPATRREVAYISSGTWSLVGVELDHPVLTYDARATNFTNEGGVDGRTRFLRNVSGLWLLEECLRTWRLTGAAHALDDLLRDAARLPEGPRIDVDDGSFLAPGDMPARIVRSVESTGERAPATEAAIVRCIVDSLAAAYASTVARASALSGRAVEIVHIVGGGSQNELLCRATADRFGQPVIAGPVEATALGNVLVQARAHGAVTGTVDELRCDLAARVPLRRYEPTAAAAS